MLKKATHDSATGEKSYWLSIPLIPFARTQSKTIKKQFEAGCTMFDLRTKFAFGEWRAAHGLWFSKRSMESILEEINEYAKDKPKSIVVFMTYEGRNHCVLDFKEKVLEWKEKFQNIGWGVVCTKYTDNTIVVNYGVVMESEPNLPGGTQAFLPLDGKRWQTLIPIPWLWKQFYFKHVEFNEETYQFVDFL